MPWDRVKDALIDHFTAPNTQKLALDSLMSANTGFHEVVSGADTLKVAVINRGLDFEARYQGQWMTPNWTVFWS